METLQSLLAVSCVIFFITYAWKILNWAWLKPKKLEACLRKQGLRGNTYRLFFGDSVDMRNMAEEAKAKPMNFSNEIVAKVMPFITTNINKYGNKSFMWFGPTPSLLITEPELMRDILSKNYVYQKIPRNPLAKLLFRGLADYETDKWAKHRRLINPAFHQEKLKNMLPAFYLSCQEMLAKWDKLVQAEESCEIDVFPYLQTMTSDAISRTAFGSNYEEGRKIFELQTEQTMYAEQVFRSIYIPGSRFVPTKRNRRMKEIQSEVKSLVLELIDKRMKFIEAGEAEKHDDLLSVLLESNYKEIQQHESKSVGMSLEEVIEECKLFYFTGQETTAGLLVWTMILLSKHPDWQARAREEVLATFGSKTPAYDELSHMKIATMIFNEILRLYPPVVMIRRLTTCETKLGGTTLPAGVQLIMPVLTLHHDKESWGDDAEEFNPERFREGVSKATKGEVSFFPFGWGPRICIGQSFAMLEAKMALVMILQRFTFELSPSYTHAPHTLMTLQPQHGAHLSLCRL